ncbi:30 kDa salivary gland allergen Aed a 3-like [Uranotaenia lowii]|uniref:30 kDa salivary gland allergen Aed a 3-like n=1 Tax=Uranotaenia lowii TaxID=190385 RepID=UPI00247B1B75|nr:30 kDa salivary gland allergen Aed a 3-like [Uranotaenia lowii]
MAQRWNFSINICLLLRLVQLSSTLGSAHLMSENPSNMVESECPPDDGMVTSTTLEPASSNQEFENDDNDSNPSTPAFDSETPAIPAEYENENEHSKLNEDATEAKPSEEDLENPAQADHSKKDDRPGGIAPQDTHVTEGKPDGSKSTTEEIGTSSSEKPDLQRTYDSVVKIIYQAGEYHIVKDMVLEAYIRNTIQEHLINPVIRGTAPCPYFSKIKKCFDTVEADVKAVTLESAKQYRACSNSNQKVPCAIRSCEAAAVKYAEITKGIVKCAEDSGTLIKYN